MFRQMKWGWLLLLVACAEPHAASQTVEIPPAPAPATTEHAPFNQGQPVQPLPTIDATEAARIQTSRDRMVQEGVIEWGIDDDAVIAAMRIVPRHQFVPEEYVTQAYANHPLPIGFGQTISQPYIVALMSQSAELSDTDRVLEIGTGSGYQAAVLAELSAEVYTIEIIEALADRARDVLQRLGYDNVTVRHADGYYGWEEIGPFDAILVTAAPDHVPQPLIQQLAVGGHMIIPVGPVGGVQSLWRVTRLADGEIQTANLGSVRFVPFTREER